MLDDESDEPGKLARFNKLRGIIGGAEMLRSYVIAAIEGEFPELLRIVSDPQRWIGSLPPWMALGASRLGPKSIYIEVVEAPLTFGASYIRVRRSRFGSSANIFVINGAFLAAVRHTLATFRGVGLPTSELTQFFKELADDATRLRRGPHGQAVPVDVIIPGIAWMVCHEIAHATGGSIVNRDALEVPRWCRESAAQEVDADLAALRMLCHRIDATPHVGDTQARRSRLFNAIEMVLRGFALIDSIRRGREIGVDGYGSVFDDGSPTPTYRWKFLRNEMKVHRDLGLLGDDNVPIFADWDATVARIVSGKEAVT